MIFQNQIKCIFNKYPGGITLYSPGFQSGEKGLMNDECRMMNYEIPNHKSTIINQQ